MKTYLPLLLNLLIGSIASAASFSGLIVPASMIGQTQYITLTPLSAPSVSGSSIISGAPIYTNTDNTGNLAMSLAPGNYRITINSNMANSLLFYAPDDAGSYLWSDVVSVPVPVLGTFTPAYLQRALLQGRGDLLAKGEFGVTNLAAGADGQVLMSQQAAAHGLLWTNLSVWNVQRDMINKGSILQGTFKLYHTFLLLPTNFNSVAYFDFPDSMKVGTNFQMITWLTATNQNLAYFPWSIRFMEFPTNMGFASMEYGTVRSSFQPSAIPNMGTNDYWVTNVFTITNARSQLSIRIEGNGTNTTPVFIRDIRIRNY